MREASWGFLVIRYLASFFLTIVQWSVIVVVSNLIGKGILICSKAILQSLLLLPIVAQLLIDKLRQWRIIWWCYGNC